MTAVPEPSDAVALVAALAALPPELAARIEEARQGAREWSAAEQCVKAWTLVAQLEADLEALLTPAFASLTPQQLANAREVWRTTPGVNHAREYIRRAWPQLAKALDDWRQEEATHG